MSTDAYDLTSPRADGRDVILCMESALREALIKADDVDLVNAHVRVARFPNPFCVSQIPTSQNTFRLRVSGARNHVVTTHGTSALFYL